MASDGIYMTVGVGEIRMLPKSSPNSLRACEGEDSFVSVEVASPQAVILSLLFSRGGLFMQKVGSDNLKCTYLSRSNYLKAATLHVCCVPCAERRNRRGGAGPELGLRW